MTPAHPPSHPMDLTGRHILVTGASAGIGRATAVLLARLGARLTLTGRDAGRLEATRAVLAGTEEGVRHRVAPFDLAEVDAIPAWIKGLAGSDSPFDGLAHCAGIQVTRPVRHVDLAFFDQILHVNLASALALARGFRQRGCHPGRGSLVFVASVAALIGQPGNAVYAASKGGLASATRALAMELLRDGIRVNAVAPAMVETEMAERTRQSMTRAQFDDILARHPMGLGQPEDVANAIAFLLADSSRWITGVTLAVDGGYLAQ